MKHIAITGGIGSGKSFVCQRLKKRGIRVYDCDEAAKRLMRQSESLKTALRELVGDKVYTADIGMLVAMLGGATRADILQGNLGGFKGAIYENLMADTLIKKGQSLYYLQKDSGMELDFLIRYKGECVPVEVKAKTAQAKSISTVRKHPEKYGVKHFIKFGDYNIGRDGDLLTLPTYMQFLLDLEPEVVTLEKIDTDELTRLAREILGKDHGELRTMCNTETSKSDQ